jgi:hypothetical protein
MYIEWGSLSKPGSRARLRLLGGHREIKDGKKMGYSPHNTCWPICRVGQTCYALEDRHTGERISWHRTLSGALRARRNLILVREGLLKEYEL